MKELFEWLAKTPIASYSIAACFVLISISIVLMYVVSFFQGRQIDFWPPKIGEKPRNKNLARQKEHSNSKSNEINENEILSLSKFLISDIIIPQSIKEKEEYIRISISGLFRIKVDGEYLLVKGKRINQYQPVGGVFKRYQASQYLFEKLGILDDNKMPIDSKSKDDLRIRVRIDSLDQFLGWYKTGKNRETSPWREFYEELVAEGLLPKDFFPYINYDHIRTHLNGIKFTKYFQCYELLIAEIYELIPNDAQLNELQKLKAKINPDLYIWANEDSIKSLGVEPQKKLIADISEHSSWII